MIETGLRNLAADQLEKSGDARPIDGIPREEPNRARGGRGAALLSSLYPLRAPPRARMSGRAWRSSGAGLHPLRSGRLRLRLEELHGFPFGSESSLNSRANVRQGMEELGLRAFKA